MAIPRVISVISNILDELQQLQLDREVGLTLRQVSLRIHDPCNSRKSSIDSWAGLITLSLSMIIMWRHYVWGWAGSQKLLPPAKVAQPAVR